MGVINRQKSPLCPSVVEFNRRESSVDNSKSTVCDKGLWWHTLCIDKLQYSGCHYQRGLLYNAATVLLVF